ncbi:MAG: hypothetical protein F6J98_04520 [Moorea sp. SIO4G2]|uniref:hypothetical protein n=1 Tax=Moorena bouillonii TaxID=207920 RepID=UPI00117CEA14|nr:hypothetical protein [Moorena bouillonii]NEO59708.1 hypothetical protein [Moorena sp. SIO4G2]
MVINLTRKVFGLHPSPRPPNPRCPVLTATDNTVLKGSRLGKYLNVRPRIRLNGLVNHGSWLSTKPQPGRRPRYANNAVGWGH